MESFINKSTPVGIGEQSVKCKKKISVRFKEGTAELCNHSDPKLRYRVMFYEMLDSRVAGIQQQFNQKRFRGSTEQDCW